MAQRALFRAFCSGGVLTFCIHHSAFIIFCFPPVPAFLDGFNPGGYCGRMKNSKQAQLNLVAFRISNGARFGDALPDRIKLLNWGINDSVKDVHPVVNNNTKSSLRLFMEEAGFDRVALDYEHNTVKGSPAYESSTEPRKVAGYGVPVVIDGDGLYLEQMVYTPSGKENALEFYDLSPAVQLADDGTVIFVHSAALCRQGAVKDLSFYTVSVEPNKQQGDDMDDALNQRLEKMEASLGDLSKQLENSKPGEELTTLSTSVKALADQVATFSAEFRGELDRRDKAAILTDATAAGKVVNLPESTLEKFSVDELREHVKGIPATVPVNRRTPSQSRASGEGLSIIEQYNAIDNPQDRAAFYKEHQSEF